MRTDRRGGGDARANADAWDAGAQMQMLGTRARKCNGRRRASARDVGAQTQGTAARECEGYWRTNARDIGALMRGMLART